MRSFFLSAVLATAAVFSTSADADGPVAGAYLAARHAALDSDFAAAARYYAQALQADMANTELLRRTMINRALWGDIEGAAIIATQLDAAHENDQIAQMLLIAQAGKSGAFADLSAQSNSQDAGTGPVVPVVDGLVRAWALIGMDEYERGLAMFDDIAKADGSGDFALYHKAMALAMLGDWEAGDAILGHADAAGMLRTRRAMLARAEILSQLGRNDEAIAFLHDAFGSSADPELIALLAALMKNDTIEFTHIRTAQDGLAEVFFSIADALGDGINADYRLIYGRLASFLRPDHVDALLLNAQLLENLGQYELAIDTYAALPDTHPAFFAAQMGQAAALQSAERTDEAINVMQRMADSYTKNPVLFTRLGNALRSQREFSSAIHAYDRAIELSQADAPNAWFLHYSRAISYERENDWPQAEADFRRALELNPDQPQVLNYLGYSLVEKQIDLDNALDMIERAVEASPSSGYIVDSLGWVLYRLGRYDEAVRHMERATELMPVDPVVNDHLGDVYWAVGRKREALFQWKRALSFVRFENASDDADPERIRRKIESGLDAVLTEEGAPPLYPVNGS